MYVSRVEPGQLLFVKRKVSDWAWRTAAKVAGRVTAAADGVVIKIQGSQPASACRGYNRCVQHLFLGIKIIRLVPTDSLPWSTRPFSYRFARADEGVVDDFVFRHRLRYYKKKKKKTTIAGTARGLSYAIKIV